MLGQVHFIMIGQVAMVIIHILQENIHILQEKQLLLYVKSVSKYPFDMRYAVWDSYMPVLMIGNLLISSLQKVQ